MKMSFIFLIFSFLFLFVSPLEGIEKSPFVWIVEKDGKTSYLLGTVYVGVSLKDMPCSSQILHQIQNSDLLFIEQKALDDFERLSEEEQRKLFIGSREEQKEIFSKLSLESQESIRERKKVMDNVLRSSVLVHFQNESEEALLELSPESREFLTKYGANPKGNHADFVHFIRFIVYYAAYFSLPSLDREFVKIALSGSLEIKALNDNEKIKKDVQSQSSSDKAPFPIDYLFVEERIAGIGDILDQMIGVFLQSAQVYKSYDIQYVKERMNMLKVGSGNINNEVFLKNRNELWFKEFMEAHEEYNSIFLAAGLAHLIGSHNLLDMLEKEGFSVERMTCSE